MKTWKVLTTDGWATIECNYCSEQEGVLYCYNDCNEDTYLDTKAVYAAGEWRKVYGLDEKG